MAEASGAGAGRRAFTRAVGRGSDSWMRSETWVWEV